MRLFFSLKEGAQGGGRRLFDFFLRENAELFVTSLFLPFN